MKKILLFLAVILIPGCQEKEKMNISKTVLEYEYGTAITSEEILACFENTDEYLEEVVINLPENEEGKDYLSIGDYELEVLHGEESANIKISVKDTVSPVFQDLKESYAVEYGQSFKQKIEAEDLSEVKVTVDDSRVDYKKAGNYKAVVKATDEAGNETEKEIAITVKEEKKEEKKEISSSATSSSSAGKGNSSKPAVNKTETSKPSSGGTSNKKPQASAHVHDGPAVESMYFDSWSELDEWAYNYQLSKWEQGIMIGSAYGGSQCSCGKVYIHGFR